MMAFHGILVGAWRLEWDGRSGPWWPGEARSFRPIPCGDLL